MLINNNFLSPFEKHRYQRQIIIPGIGEEGQLKLKSARILVIGAGGLGSPVLLYLAAAGVGNITTLDSDLVEESNFQRQIIFTTEDLVKPKAGAAAERMLKINPFGNYLGLSVRFEKDNALNYLRDVDFVIDGSDNFATRYLVNDACVIAGKPFISGSLLRFEAQISLFNYLGGPTYRCLFPDPPADGEALNCVTAGVLGTVAGMAGTIMANEALKIILNLGEVLSGKLMLIDALTLQQQLISFEKNMNAKPIVELEDDYSPASTRKCVTAGEALNNNDEITIEELNSLKNSGFELFFIDVRESWESDALPDNGINIPLNEIPSRIQEIPRDKKVVLHCSTGGRSALGVKLLKEKYNYQNVCSLKGAMSKTQ